MLVGAGVGFTSIKASKCDEHRVCRVSISGVVSVALGRYPCFGMFTLTAWAIARWFHVRFSVILL